MWTCRTLIYFMNFLLYLWQALEFLLKSFPLDLIFTPPLFFFFNQNLLNSSIHLHENTGISSVAERWLLKAVSTSSFKYMRIIL